VRDTVSEASGRRYPTRTVCEVFRVASSSLYAALERAEPNAGPPPARHRPGPKPRIPDPELLERIRQVIADSPFLGEGHRKIHARLRLQEVHVSRKRVLRITREAGLLACRPTAGPAKVHDGTIVTDAPNRMWGTDGARFLIGRGQDATWASLFITVDHFNFDPIGFEVSESGDRFHAFTAVEAAVRERFGRVGPGVARGVVLRSDLGSVYTSSFFTKRVKALGLDQSYAFVREPECNGVSERFIRLIKEQCLWVEEFTDLEDARRKIAAFIERYRHGWILERHGYRTPAQVLEQAMELVA
jgi:transposase InsO family protein